jgi:hypothetical protein
VFVERVCNVQYHDANADAGFADVAFALTAPFKRRAVTRFAVGDLLIRRAFLNPAAVPHSYSNEGSEPQDSIYGVDGEEGVGVGEALSAAPRGDHDEVDNGRDGEEALYSSISMILFTIIETTYQRKIELGRTARVAILGEDGNGDA